MLSSEDFRNSDAKNGLEEELAVPPFWQKALFPHFLKNSTDILKHHLHFDDTLRNWNFFG